MFGRGKREDGRWKQEFPLFLIENLIFVSQTNKLMTTKILIIGACGQIGTELTMQLRAVYGNDNVIA